MLLRPLRDGEPESVRVRFENGAFTGVKDDSSLTTPAKPSTLSGGFKPLILYLHLKAVSWRK